MLAGTASMVSDEVWARLDPAVGRLPAKDLRRLRRLAVLSFVVAVVAPLVWVSGVVEPQIASRRSSSSYEAGSATFSYTIDVHNRGWSRIVVVGVGRSGQGLSLVTVDQDDPWLVDRPAAFPVAIGAGQRVAIRLVYRVDDCAAVSTDPWPIPVHVRRPWGTRTVYTAQEPDFPVMSGATVTHAGQPREWQHALALASCS